MVQTFDGNCFVYSVPGSAANSLSWPTARSSYLRQGRAISSEAVPRPTILDITVTGNSATIDWKADPRRRQRLECSDDPGAAVPVWTVLQTYEPPTSVTNRFVDTPLRDTRYYRVRAE